MSRIRLSLLVASFILSASLALAAQDLVYSFIVVPVSYIAWQVGVLFRAVPQLIWWAALVVIAVLVIAWQLVPELGPVKRGPQRRPPVRGQVRTAALSLRRARGSYYFKWQLANRLGRVWNGIRQLPASALPASPGESSVVGFLKAGMEHSFVEFPSRHRLLRVATPTLLDVDPEEVVSFLESQIWLERGDHARPL